ncbi:MAG TPA: hypothetical protein VJ280_06730 [Dehalococcoidales bacterium]|jgi:hypothetical protein|nr:hypothetical protein [Dehalococcoidales bacterium]
MGFEPVFEFTNQVSIAFAPATIAISPSITPAGRIWLATGGATRFMITILHLFFYLIS